MTIALIIIGIVGGVWALGAWIGWEALGEVLSGIAEALSEVDFGDD